MKMSERRAKVKARPKTLKQNKLTCLRKTKRTNVEEVQRTDKWPLVTLKKLGETRSHRS